MIRTPLQQESNVVLQIQSCKLLSQSWQLVRTDFFAMVLLDVHALCRQASCSWRTSYNFIMLRFFLTTDPHFILVITVSMGILSCITTAWWGALSLTIFSQTNWLRAITVFRSTRPDKRHGNIYHRSTSYRFQFYHGGPFPKTRTWRILVPSRWSYGRRRPWRHVVTLPHSNLRI